MDTVFIYSLAVLGVSLIGLLLKYSFKSKCVDIDLCYGCIHIKRDIENENIEEKNELRLDKNNSTQSFNIASL